MGETPGRSGLLLDATVVEDMEVEVTELNTEKVDMAADDIAVDIQVAIAEVSAKEVSVMGLPGVTESSSY
jgi:hypothetical protein